MSIHDKLVLFGVIVASVVLHELGHALSAIAFGDDTPRREGHLTLNPWKISPFGAVILPALLILAGSTPIAFAATPVNPRNMRNPRLHSLLVSLAGPAVNIALIAVSVAVLRTSHSGELPQVAFWLGYVNVILAVFNLIPMPPLDGSALLERVLPREWWPGYIKVRPYGIGILILVVLALPTAFGHLIDPFLNLWSHTWTRAVLF